MWIEERATQQGTVYRYIERYTCPTTHKIKRVSVTLKSNTPKARKTAYNKLMCKINKALAAEEKKREPITLFKAIEMWLAFYKPTVAIRTQNGYDASFRRIKSLFDDVLLSDLQSIYVEEVLVKFHHVDGATHKYTMALLNIIKNALHYAKRKGYLTNDEEFLEIKIKAKKKTLEEKKKADDKFLDSDELKLCFKQLATIHRRIGLLCEFLAYTGLRAGELLALRECDYNKDKAAIDVNGTYNAETRTRGTPKNLYSYRTVTLNSRAAEIIEHFINSNRWQYVSQGTPPEESRYIFINQNGNPYEIQQINKALKKVNVNGKHLTTHIFRHSHVSLLSEMNIPLKAIMARVGHNDARTTLEIYDHVTRKMKESVLEKLNSLSI